MLTKVIVGLAVWVGYIGYIVYHFEEGDISDNYPALILFILFAALVTYLTFRKRRN